MWRNGSTIFDLCQVSVDPVDAYFETGIGWRVTLKTFTSQYKSVFYKNKLDIMRLYIRFGLNL